MTQNEFMSVKDEYQEKLVYWNIEVGSESFAHG